VLLPETIPVRYTEEDAEYVSVRPVKRQTFRLRELLDMILSVAGRDAARIQRILHSGTVVYHFYRYSWQGFDADAAELFALLAEFPSDLPPGDPRRAFDPRSCTAALIESATAARAPVEIDRAATGRKPLFAARSFWDCLLALASSPASSAVRAADPPAPSTAPVGITYAGYSYARRADLFRLDLSPEQSSAILRDAARLAPRSLRTPIAAMGALRRILFVSAREAR